jgi:medium-chain acyl-[acyl-carrier-protein] hydrolase
MKYKVLGYPLPAPKLRVLCFHCAGSAESIYTGPSDFIKWAKETKAVEVCAFDYPGRDKLLKAPKHTSIATLAPELLAVFYEKLTDGVPYVVWGHSVGTWVCYEFLQAARMMGLPMPVAAFLMAFPAPHMPEDKRTWHRNKELSEAQFKEELRNWDKGHFEGPGKVVYDEPGWKETWQPLMRADFTLFDEYKFAHEGKPKFEFPIHAWHFEGEHYNKADQIELWKDCTSGAFDFEVMKGMGHLTCVYKPDMKKAYFAKVLEHIKKYSGL